MGHRFGAAQRRAGHMIPARRDSKAGKVPRLEPGRRRPEPGCPENQQSTIRRRLWLTGMISFSAKSAACVEVGGYAGAFRACGTCGGALGIGIDVGGPED